ncbi:hypothetical protein ACW7G2_03300 [Luteimonas sp. A277]
MTSERIEAITEAAKELAQELEDCRGDAREAIGQRIMENYDRRQRERTTFLYRPTVVGETADEHGKRTLIEKPFDNAHAFVLLQILLAAAAGDTWDGWPAKGDA